MSRSAIGTLLERTTRYVRLVHLPDGHSADQLVAGTLATLDDLPDQVRRTLTWDQGSEMARHDLLAAHASDGIYFAEPANPGSEARTRTPTDCPASTSPRATT